MYGLVILLEHVSCFFADFKNKKTWIHGSMDPGIHEDLEDLEDLQDLQDLEELQDLCDLGDLHDPGLGPGPGSRPRLGRARAGDDGGDDDDANIFVSSHLAQSMAPRDEIS